MNQPGYCRETGMANYLKMEKDKSFLGRGWSFPPTFDKEIGGVVMTSNEEDIEKSLEILLNTHIGERYLQPGFGCALGNFAFEALNASEAYIKDLINDAIIFHEPRIELDDIFITAKPGQGLMEISIEYTVVSTNTRYNYVYPFYINEGTNITL